MKDLLVVKNYSLVNAKYKLTLTEANFIYILMSKIFKEDKEFKEYEFSKSELENILETQQNIVRIKQLARNLMSKTLEVETKEKWKILTWFKSIEYIKNDGIIRVKISDDLKYHLLNLKNRFVSCELKYLLEFKSIYSKRIYELLVEYKKIGTRTLKVEDMQEMFQVTKSLLKYADFKRYVLEVALKEINEKTDLTFSYTPIKPGRKVIAIKFDIKLKKGSK